MCGPGGMREAAHPDRTGLLQPAADEPAALPVGGVGLRHATHGRRVLPRLLQLLLPIALHLRRQRQLAAQRRGGEGEGVGAVGRGAARSGEAGREGASQGGDECGSGSLFGGGGGLQLVATLM